MVLSLTSDYRQETLSYIVLLDLSLHQLRRARGGVAGLLLHLEGLSEAKPGVVAGYERVLDEEDLQDIPR